MASDVDAIDILPRRVLASPDGVREALGLHLPEVLERLASDAKAGDPQALRLYMQHAITQERPDAERVLVPGLAAAQTLQEKADCVLAAVAASHCSAEAGEKLLRLIDTYGKAVVMSNHEARLAAIEGAQRGRLPVAERVEPITGDFGDFA